MPFVIVGGERFAIAIGETRIGGSGDDALPFAELVTRPTVALLTLTPDGTTTLSRVGDSDVAITVDGRPLAEALKLAHGAKIDIAGLRLVFGDLRQHGATAHVRDVGHGHPAVLAEVVGEPTADSGGRVIALATGATTSIPETGLVIGRDPECHVVLHGLEVSRHHAEIRPSIRGYVLTDRSTTGTYVNRRRVDGAQLLGMGDVIRIGDEELRFEADAASYDPTPELRPKTTAPLSVAPATPTTTRQSAVLLATLEIINEGLLKGKRFRLERPVASVGRHGHNDVQLADDTVSGAHATLTKRTSGWVLLDHGSTNGTYVDGERITAERQLPAVAELRFGGVKMLFRTIAGSAGAAGAKKTKAVVGVSLEQSKRSNG